MKNGYVQIYEDKHHYCAPCRFIGRKVKLIYSISQVSVFYNRKRIAYHNRNLKKYGYITTKDHLSSTHRFVSEWNPDKFISGAGAIAPVVQAYTTCILDKATYPEQAYRSCVGILSHKKKVGKERLIKTIERATLYGAFNYTIIRKILQTGMDQVPPSDDIRIPKKEIIIFFVYQLFQTITDTTLRQKATRGGQHQRIGRQHRRIYNFL